MSGTGDHESRVKNIHAMVERALTERPVGWTRKALVEGIRRATELPLSVVEPAVADALAGLAVIHATTVRTAAVEVVRARPWMLNAADLTSAVVKRTRLSRLLVEPTVAELLARAARDGGHVVGRRPTTVQPAPPVDQWEALRTRLERLQRQPDVTLVRVRVRGSDPMKDPPEVDLRLDTLEVSGVQQVRVTAYVRSVEVLVPLATRLPHMLRSDGRLDDGLGDVVTAPTMVAGSLADPSAAATLVVETLRDDLGIDIARIRDWCDVRSSGSSGAVRGARERVLRLAHEHRRAAGVDCVACHRPLTDPESIRRGWGPVCFARLSPQLQELVSRRNLPPLSPQAKAHMRCLSVDSWRMSVLGRWWRWVPGDAR